MNRQYKTEAFPQSFSSRIQLFRNMPSYCACKEKMSAVGVKKLGKCFNSISWLQSSFSLVVVL